MRASLKALKQRESLASCANNQRDLFDHSVVEHAMPDESLCLNHAESSIRMMENPVRKSYPQKWHEDNLSQTLEESKFKELLFELCKGIEEPVQVMGRPRAPIADLIFACCLKVYSGMSGRRNQSDMRESVMRGYLSRPVHFNTNSKHLEREELTPYLRQIIEESALPLRGVESTFAADSSGFCAGVATEWLKAKYAKRPDAKMISWLKVHIMCGVKTNIITSCEVSGRWESDHKYFPPLVEATARNFEMSEIVADKGYPALLT